MMGHKTPFTVVVEVAEFPARVMQQKVLFMVKTGIGGQENNSCPVRHVIGCSCQIGAGSLTITKLIIFTVVRVQQNGAATDDNVMISIPSA